MNKALFVFFLLIVSCNKNKDAVKEIEPEIVTVKLPPSPNDYHFDSTEVRCKNDLARAKKEFKKGKLAFSNFGIFAKNYDEIKELLNKKGIDFKPLGENCTGESNCYGYYMDSILKRKFGNNFFSIIKAEAKKLSESRWKTKVYSYSDVDEPAVYPNTNDVYRIHDVVKKMFKNPENWDSGKMDNYESEFVSIRIIVDSNGKSIVPEKYNLGYNLKKNNLKHLKYLEKEIKNVIAQFKLWKPAIVNGHNVKSEEYVDVYFN